MLESDKTVFETAKQTHEEIYNSLKQLTAQTRQETEINILVDRIYALREAAKLLDDTRKECNRLADFATRLACLIWAQGDSSEPIRTEYCTGSPDVQMSVNIPNKKRDPVAFCNLMKFLGVPENLYLTESEIVRPHWPGLVEMLTARLSKGLPLPEGIDVNATVPIYKITIRGKKGILSDSAVTVDELPF